LIERFVTSRNLLRDVSDARGEFRERPTVGRDARMFRAGFTLIRRLIYAACLLILLICGVEVGVRAYELVTGGPPYCQSSDGTCADCSKLAVPSWSFHQELKPLAWASVECRDTATEIEIRTNSLGLRATEPTIPKPPGVYRIVVLGDETILAPETAEAEHFCTLLQNQIQQMTRIRIEVINAGIPGHCPLTEYLLFKQRLLNLQPDLLLLHFDWSDVSDDRQIRRNAKCDAAGIPQSCPHGRLVAPKKTRAHDVLRQQFRLVDVGLNFASDKWRQELAQQKAISRNTDVNPYAWLRDERPDQNVAFRQSREPIADLAQLCASSACQFVVMTSPKPWQVSAKCSRGEGVRLAAGVASEACFSNREPFRVLARFLQKANIPFIDGSSDLMSGPDAQNNFLKHAPRWAPTGHRKMADRVARFLVENLQGPWSSPYFQPDQPQPMSHGNHGNTAIQRTSAERFDPAKDPGSTIKKSDQH
jgi:hypothetical protein